MIQITIGELSKRVEMTEAEVCATLEQGWTIRLLAAAGSVTEGYFRQLLTRRQFPGTKLGTVWLISREDGDAWLKEKKDTIIVE
ncbi:MAG: hypothetical protein JXA33_19110 [Anaerolineae bacterium]|nr:hypothetical protein [Anaerolineae bacterium]